MLTSLADVKPPAGGDIKFMNASATSSGMPASVPIGEEGTNKTSSGVADQSNENRQSAFFKTAKHPGICFVHTVFKIIPLLLFIFGSFLFGGWEGDYVFTFVFSTLLLAMDFWTTKNITGRLLVGMRWWNVVLEDGTNLWKYECSSNEQYINSTDKHVFWSGLYAGTAVWVFMAFFELIQFEISWFLLTIVGTALNAANLLGYWNCSADSKRRVQEWASSQIFKLIFTRGSGLWGGAAAS